MANISQHEAAELWELARDHFLTAAKLQFLGQHAQDTQLRSLTEQHIRRIQQAGHQIAGLISHESPGFNANQGGFQAQQGFSQFQSAPSFTGGQQGFGAEAQGQQGFGFGGGTGFSQARGTDILIAGEALKDCKRLAVALVQGATEASQPARNLLYQLAGEQLQMAEQHYRWLEQRGLYASPKADYQTIQEYGQKVRQISQAGQQAVQEHGAWHPQGVLVGSAAAQAGQSQPYGGQAHLYGYSAQGTLSASTGAVRSGQQYSQ
ncbi:MAG: spore coat protein [Limnochordia bacterium]